MGQRLCAALTVVATSLTAAACSARLDSGRLTELQRVRSGMFDVFLLSPRDALRHGRDTFVIEFRETSGGALVDAGTVRATATMPMPGMPMLASIDVRPTNVAGRYEATSDFSMAGTWRMTLEWNGPAGPGSASFAGNVR